MQVILRQSLVSTAFFLQFHCVEFILDLLYIRISKSVKRLPDFIHFSFSRYAFLSVYDRSKLTQNKINFVKNCSQCGLNPQPPDHHSNALPTELSHYLVFCVNH